MDRPRQRVDGWVIAGALAAGAVGVLIAARQVPVAAGLVTALLLLAAHIRSSRALVALGLVLPLLPALEDVPLSIVFAGKSIYLSDVLLPLGLVLAALTTARLQWRRVVSDVGPVVLVLVVGIATGVVHGSSTSFLLRDLRGPTYLLLAFTATVLLFRQSDKRAVLRVVALLLWSAAILVVVESVTGFEFLAGRVEDVARVEAALSGVGLDATRFLVAPKDLALLCCCAGLAVLLRGGTTINWTWLGPAILLPSTLLVFFSFSRRALLALAFATAFVLIVTKLQRVLVRVLVMMPVVVGIYFVLSLTPLSSEYVSQQAGAFSDRVLTGLSSEARSQDQGIAFRAVENDYAAERVFGSPVVGLGLGATYRPDVAGQPFEGDDIDYGRTYIHNYYLWVAVKLGLLGFVIMLAFFLRPIVAVARVAARSRDEQDQALLAIAAGVVGLLAVNWVSPISNEPATAIVLGCALAALRIRTLPGAGAPGTRSRVDASGA